MTNSSRSHRQTSGTTMNAGDGLKKLSEEAILDAILVFNVGGSKFETTLHTLQTHPGTKLAQFDAIKEFYRPDTGEYFLDRDPDVFKAVLNYYRLGELHVPLDVCGQVFQRELEFWKIDENDIQQCCWGRYHDFREKREMLKNMEKVLQSFDETKFAGKGAKLSKWKAIQRRGWLFMEYPASSRAAMAFAIWSAFVVALSISAFCLETIPELRFNMTRADWADYSGLTADSFRDTYYLEGDYDDDDEYYDDEDSDDDDLLSDLSPTTDSLAGDGGTTQTSGTARPPPKKGEGTTASYDDETTTMTNATDYTYADDGDDTTQASVTGESTTESYEYDYDVTTEKPKGGKPGHNIRRRNAGEPSTRKTNSPNQNTRTNRPRVKARFTTPSPGLAGDYTKPHEAFYYLQVFCFFYFTLEFAARLIFAPQKCSFILGPITIIDALSLAGLAAILLEPVYAPHNKYVFTELDSLFAVFQICRIFPIFRILSKMKGAVIIAYTFKTSLKEIALMAMFLLISVLIFGTVMFYVNRNASFDSIPKSFWWALVTMTTVGYGDMAPNTRLGYAIGALCTVCGVLVIAFTVPIVVGNFMLYYGHAQSRIGREDADDHRAEEKVDEKKAQTTRNLRRFSTVVTPSSHKFLPRLDSVGEKIDSVCVSVGEPGMDEKDENLAKVSC